MALIRREELADRCAPIEYDQTRYLDAARAQSDHMRACARLLMLNACLTCLQIALLFGYDAHNGPAEPADAGFLVELLPEYTGGPRAPLLSVLETFESYSLRTRAQGAAPPRGPCRTHMRPLLAPVVISSRSECVLGLRGQRRVSVCGFKS